jgi:hypothetical protein
MQRNTEFVARFVIDLKYEDVPKHNLIWVSLQHVDKIARFDPKTETWVEFPLA